MAILIVYASKHGVTGKCANALRERLPGADVWNLKNGQPDLMKYDAVILGASVYAGIVRRRMKAFAAKHEDALSKKKVGLFLCCMAGGKQAQREMEAAYPEGLRKAAAVQGVLGGGFNVSDMGAFERFIVKKITKTDAKDSLNLCPETMDAFVKAFGQG